MFCKYISKLIILYLRQVFLTYKTTRKYVKWCVENDMSVYIKESLRLWCFYNLKNVTLSEEILLIIHEASNVKYVLNIIDTISEYKLPITLKGPDVFKKDKIIIKDIKKESDKIMINFSVVNTTNTK